MEVKKTSRAPALEEALHEVAVDLGIEVVDGGLEDGDLLEKSGRLVQVPQEAPEKIGAPLRVAAPGAVSDPGDAQGRHGAELVAQGGRQRRAGGGDQLAPEAVGVERLPLQDLHRGRRRNREDAVLAADRAGSRGEGGDDDPVHLQRLQADAGADDVHDGVHRPHFMEVDPRRRDAMDAGLRLHQRLEDLQRPRFHPVVEAAPPDDPADLPDSPVALPPGDGSGLRRPRPRGRGIRRRARARRWPCRPLSGIRTRTWVPQRPARRTCREAREYPFSRSRESSRLRCDSGTPRSTDIPRNMSPLMPEKQSR